MPPFSQANFVPPTVKGRRLDFLTNKVIRTPETSYDDPDRSEILGFWDRVDEITDPFNIENRIHSLSRGYLTNPSVHVSTQEALIILAKYINVQKARHEVHSRGQGVEQLEHAQKQPQPQSLESPTAPNSSQDQRLRPETYEVLSSMENIFWSNLRMNAITVTNVRMLYRS